MHCHKYHLHDSHPRGVAAVRRRARRKSQRWLWLAGGDTAARLGSEDTTTAARTQATERRLRRWRGGGLNGGGGGGGGDRHGGGGGGCEGSVGGGVGGANPVRAHAIRALSARAHMRCDPPGSSRRAHVEEEVPRANSPVRPRGTCTRPATRQTCSNARCAVV